jgi:protein KRI1
MMARAFDDEYYEKQDGEALTAVPETSAVKEILKAEESDDSEESETEDKEEVDEDVDEVVSKPASVAPRTEEDGDSDADFEGEGIIHRPGTAGHAGDVDGADDDFAGDVQKLGRHMKVPLEKYLQDLDKMDYEDVLADGFKTRFKYREIEPKRYGLSVEEILELDDKSLNRHVSIKRLAPYRDDADMTEGMYRNKKRKLNADAQEMEKKMFKKELKRKERHVQEKAQELGISADTYEAYQLSSKSSKSKSEVEAVQKRMRQMKEQAKRERRKERDNAEKKKKKQEAQA